MYMGILNSNSNSNINSHHSLKNFQKGLVKLNALTT